MLPATEKTKINLYTSSDKEDPLIRSMTMIQGHFCVALDKGNKSIKVFDTNTGSITSDKSMKMQFLWGLTSIGMDHFALSATLSNQADKIQIYSVSNAGCIQSIEKELPVKFTYFELMHSKDHFYACRHNEVHVLDMNGKILRTFHNATAKGDVFQFIHGIAVSQENKTIYVTDGIENTITSLTMDGVVRAVYKNVDVDKPWGITVDNRGFVYVCSWNTSSIYQLTADLQNVGVLLDNVYGTRLIFSNNQLCIYDRDTIVVYDSQIKHVDQLPSKTPDFLGYY